MAEVSRRWTPYNYAYNNPIYFVDPDGMLSGSFNNGYFNVDIEQFGGSMESWVGGFWTEGSDRVQQPSPGGGNDNPEVAVQNTYALSTTPDDGGGGNGSFSTGDLFALAAKNGVTSKTEAGLAFEKAVLEYLGLTPN